jgi:hypothetical protein
LSHVRQVEGGWLLKGNVLARLQGGNGHFGVDAMRGEDLHRIHGLLGQKLAVVGVPAGGAPLLRSAAGGVLHDVADRVEFSVGVIAIDGGVQVGDAAGTNESYP